MTVSEFYDEIHGDYKGTLSRFLTEERMRRFALKFESDPSYDQLLDGVRAGDIDSAFRAAHTLKGVCQNLGFDWLYEISFEITEILRSGSLDVQRPLDELKTRYGVVMTAIRNMKNDENN